MIPKPSFIFHANFSRDSQRRCIVWTYGGSNSAQGKLVEAKIDQYMNRIGSVATSPLIRIDGISDLCRPDASERKSGKPDQLVVTASYGQIEFITRMMSRSLDSASHHFDGLFHGATVEGQVLSDPIVADDGVHVGSVVFAEFAQRDNAASESYWVHGLIFLAYLGEAAHRSHSAST